MVGETMLSLGSKAVIKRVHTVIHGGYIGIVRARCRIQQVQLASRRRVLGRGRAGYVGSRICFGCTAHMNAAIADIIKREKPVRRDLVLQAEVVLLHVNMMKVERKRVILALRGEGSRTRGRNRRGKCDSDHWVAEATRRRSQNDRVAPRR